MNRTDQNATDVIIAALAQLLSDQIDLRDQFLAEQTPATREAYWGEVTESRERLGI